MYEGWRGEWAFTLPYTAEKGAGAPIFLFYIFLGQLSRLTSIPTIWMFHLARIAGVFFLVRELVLFMAGLFPNSKNSLRKTAGLALLGSGFGWILILFGIIISDVWVAEGYPFLSSFSSPHFTIGMALLIRIFSEMLLPESAGKIARLLLWGFLIALIMPFGWVSASLVAGIWALVEWRNSKHLYWRSLVALGSAGGIYLAYQYWAILRDPLLSQWNAQNQTPSPAAWDLLLSFSPALLFAGWGAWRWIRNRHLEPQQRLVLIWFLAGLALLYFPFSLQRRFIFALFIPISILAMAGIQAFMDWRPSFAKKALPVFWISSFLTNGVVIIAGLVWDFQPPTPIFCQRG